MKNIKDYIHLYLGCLVHYPDTEGKTIKAHLTGVSTDQVETTYLRVRTGPGSRKTHGDYLSWKSNGNHNSDALHMKLVLRRRGDMTDEEKLTLASIIGGVSHLHDSSKIANVDDLMGSMWHRQTNIEASKWMEACRYLCSIRIDVFNLEEDNLAIILKKKP